MAVGRVIMLTTDARIDRRILLQAEAVAADGWEVEVVAMPLPGGSALDPPFVRRLPNASGSLRERALSAAHLVAGRVLPMNGRLMRSLKAIAWSRLADPSTFFLHAFEPTVRDLRADIVVAHDLPVLPAGAWLADRVGARLVYDSHELWPEQNFPIAWKCAWADVEARFIRRCDLVMTVNRSIAGELERRHGIDSVLVVTNAVPAWSGDPRSLRERCGLPGRSRMLLYQGSLSEGRQLVECVRSIAQVTDAGIHLVLLGDGVLRARLAREARRARVSRRVHLLPAVPQAELLSWTASADGGLVPYVADCMNSSMCTPNKLYEFIAAGLPILASDLPELRSMVKGEGFGLVADMRSPEAIAEAISTFFRDQAALERWKGSVAAGRARHCWEVQADLLRAAYRSLAPGNASRLRA